MTRSQSRASAETPAGDQPTVDGLQACISQLQARISQLEDTSRTATQAQPTPQPQLAPQPQPTPQSKEPRLGDPEFFSGEGRKLRNFVAKCRLSFRTQPSRFPTEQLKVSYALSFLRDKAFTRFEPLLNKDSPPELESFDSFAKVLESNFGEPDQEAAAMRQICALRQTTSAASYASEFKGLQQFIDWNDGAFRNQFYIGLKDSVKDELIKTDRPPNLEALMELAIKIDNRLYERRLEKKKAQQTYQHDPKLSLQKQPQLRHRSSPASATSAADTDAAKEGTSDSGAARSRFKPLTDAEKQRRRTLNLCLYCAEPDHMVIDCPVRPKLYKQNRPHASKAYGMSKQQFQPSTQGKEPARI